MLGFLKVTENVFEMSVINMLLLNACFILLIKSLHIEGPWQTQTPDYDLRIGTSRCNSYWLVVFQIYQIQSIFIS